MMPKLVRILYGGKFCGVQFGFEGYLNAPTIEGAIFGGIFSRFSWSTNGSPLSRSIVNNLGEKVAIDPCKDPGVRMKKQALPGDKSVSPSYQTRCLAQLIESRYSRL